MGEVSHRPCVQEEASLFLNFSMPPPSSTDAFISRPASGHSSIGHVGWPPVTAVTNASLYFMQSGPGGGVPCWPAVYLHDCLLSWLLCELDHGLSGPLAFYRNLLPRYLLTAKLVPRCSTCMLSTTSDSLELNLRT
ncbi:hypothetical protein MTO96_028806 [Rhipicephalus appendiculatus]